MTTTTVWLQRQQRRALRSTALVLEAPEDIASTAATASIGAPALVAGRPASITYKTSAGGRPRTRQMQPVEIRSLVPGAKVLVLDGGTLLVGQVEGGPPTDVSRTRLGARHYGRR